MSKSYGNCIYLSDSEEDVEKKVKGMVTDPARVRKTDPGNPEICPVFAYHNIFTDREKIKEIEEDCRGGRIGCVQCKKILSENLNRFLSPIREKRQKYLSKRKEMVEIFVEGSKKAKEVAGETMEEVRSAMNFLKPEDL